jgi:translation initiation factor IF-3
MKKFNNKREHFINEEIREYSVRLPEGIVKTTEALKMAQDSEMDLVCVNTTTTPPICKIVNYEKFLYEQKKKLKNKVKTAELKEIKLGPNTSENDVEYRIKHIIEFLDKGHKVKISMQFKGRQMNHVDKGQELLLKLILEVEEHGTAESLPKLEGKKMSVTLKPKPKK